MSSKIRKLKKAYREGQITEEYIVALFEAGKITEEERDYILG